MKLCKDCAYYSSDEKCYRNAVVETDLVSGSEWINGIKQCQQERYTYRGSEQKDKCGEDGIYFKPKQTVWKRIKSRIKYGRN